MLLLVIVFVLVTNINVLGQSEVKKLASKSDLVIIGTVKELKDTPAPYDEMFHSIVTIDVDSVLKGKAGKNIMVRLRSGLITHNRKIVVSSEPVFKVGSKYILFLNNLNSPHAKDYNNSKLSEGQFWVSNTRTFEVRNDSVYYFDKVIRKSDFINNIKQR